MAFGVALFLVVFHHRPRSYLLGPFAITTRLLSGFLDVLVLSLFLGTDALEMLLTGHNFHLPSKKKTCRKTSGVSTTKPFGNPQEYRFGHRDIFPFARRVISLLFGESSWLRHTHPAPLAQPWQQYVLPLMTTPPFSHSLLEEPHVRQNLSTVQARDLVLNDGFISE
jgi:hypothetical protein